MENSRQWRAVVRIEHEVFGKHMENSRQWRAVVPRVVQGVVQPELAAASLQF